jgi:hypothetical protein
VMALSLTLAQAPVGFFPPKSTSLSPVESALADQDYSLHKSSERVYRCR